MRGVPWIRFYTSFPRHRKAVLLKRLLGTWEPIVCLWCWAAENARDGDLSQFTAREIESFAEWTGKSNKALDAMVQVGFVDMDGDRIVLHDWMEGAGAGIATLSKNRKRQCELMRNVRANVRANSDAHVVKTPSLSLRSIPDSGSGSESADLLASGSRATGVPGEEAPFGEPSRTPIRPTNSTNLLHCLGVALMKAQPQACNGGGYVPGPFASREADQLLREAGGPDAADEIQRRIGLFVADPAMSPWSVKRFHAEYMGLGQPKQRPGQPKPVTYGDM